GILPVVAVAVGVCQSVELSPGDLIGMAGDERGRRRRQRGPPRRLSRELSRIGDVLVDPVLFPGHQYMSIREQKERTLPGVARGARRVCGPPREGTCGEAEAL